MLAAFFGIGIHELLILGVLLLIVLGLVGCVVGAVVLVVYLARGKS